MQPIVLGQLPDDILTWRGTAAAMADQCNALLGQVGLPNDIGCANERLVRHYVQVGVLSLPEKEGREAIFDHRHISQFLAARHLLNDGWSLAKISELFRAAGPESMTALVPEKREPTRAELALARLKGRGHSHAPTRPPSSVGVPARESTFSNIDTSYAASLSPSLESVHEPMSEPLRQAAEITMRRMSLKSTLAQLGNASGQPIRRQFVQIELAPWCQVYVDSEMLKQLPTDSIESLGSALTQALHEERITRGEKS